MYWWLFPSAAHTQRLLKLQSILRRAPSYRTLELQLIEWQERELFEYFVVVSLKKKPSKNSYFPEVTYQFPKVRAWRFWIRVTLLSLCNAADRRGWFEKNLMEHVSVFRCLDHISLSSATDKTGSKNVLEQEMSGDAVFLLMIYQNM